MDLGLATHEDPRLAALPGRGGLTNSADVQVLVNGNVIFFWNDLKCDNIID